LEKITGVLSALNLKAQIDDLKRRMSAAEADVRANADRAALAADNVARIEMYINDQVLPVVDAAQLASDQALGQAGEVLNTAQSALDVARALKDSLGKMGGQLGEDVDYLLVRAGSLINTFNRNMKLIYDAVDNFANRLEENARYLASDFTALGNAFVTATIRIQWPVNNIVAELGSLKHELFVSINPLRALYAAKDIYDMLAYAFWREGMTTGGGTPYKNIIAELRRGFDDIKSKSYALRDQFLGFGTRLQAEAKKIRSAMVTAMQQISEEVELFAGALAAIPQGMKESLGA
jgi:hypothetical protein